MVVFATAAVIILIAVVAVTTTTTTTTITPTTTNTVANANGSHLLAVASCHYISDVVITWLLLTSVKLN